MKGHVRVAALNGAVALEFFHVCVDGAVDRLQERYVPDFAFDKFVSGVAVFKAFAAKERPVGGNEQGFVAGRQPEVFGAFVHRQVLHVVAVGFVLKLNLNNEPHGPKIKNPCEAGAPVQNKSTYDFFERGVTYGLTVFHTMFVFREIQRSFLRSCRQRTRRKAAV